DPAPDRAAARARPRRRRGRRLGRDRQVAEGRARRDRRRDRARLLHRRRGAALLRPDDAERGAEPAGDDPSAAARGRRADHRGEHADRERRLEGLPRAALRERRRAEGVRGRSADGCGVRPDRRRSGASARSAERAAGVRRGGGAAARRGPPSRRRLLHRLDRRRPADRPGRRRAAGEGLPGARRQEPARRLRRRGSRQGRRSGSSLGLLERRPAVCGRVPAGRVRLGLRALPRAAGRAGGRPEGRTGRRARFRPGDQRAPAREHARRRPAGPGRGGHGGHGRRAPADAGYYLAPTIVEGVGADAEISRTELFGPITTLHRVRDFDEALAVANASPYGLTAAVWTASVHRAQEFVRRVVAGGVQVNGPTYGFEPHVPFGGQRDSGTGWREPGTEALDVYSDWKTVYVTHDPALA